MVQKMTVNGKEINEKTPTQVFQAQIIHEQMTGAEGGKIGGQVYWGFGGGIGQSGKPGFISFSSGP